MIEVRKTIKANKNIMEFDSCGDFFQIKEVKRMNAEIVNFAIDIGESE